MGRICCDKDSFRDMWLSELVEEGVLKVCLGFSVVEMLCWIFVGVTFLGKVYFIFGYKIFKFCFLIFRDVKGYLVFLIDFFFV